jgi:hypothetical protein
LKKKLTKKKKKRQRGLTVIKQLDRCLGTCELHTNEEEDRFRGPMLSLFYFRQKLAKKLAIFWRDYT